MIVKLPILQYLLFAMLNYNNNHWERYDTIHELKETWKKTEQWVSLGDIYFNVSISVSPFFFQAIAMRLFKRQSDTSPQLVSATPLSHDGASPLTVVEENLERSSKKPHNENDGLNRTLVKENANETLKPSSSTISNRKGNK